MAKASTTKLVTAFAAVYIIWGSTYLAIRYAIQTFPPLLMASSRFLIAGSFLYGFSRFKGCPPGTTQGWRRAFIVGAMLLLCGNGGVVLAERTVPSGLTAVLVSMVPVWVAVFSWILPGGRRPSQHVALGIVLGFAGVTTLIGLGSLNDTSQVDPVGASILIVSSMSWAAGSLYGQKAHVSNNPLQTSGMQMLGGGTFLLLAGLLSGEARAFRPHEISTSSTVALLYLAVFGSIVAFTAYSWLLKATTTARAATYAYVNPAVAVVLGWAVAGEPLTVRTVLSMCVIVIAVMVITTAKVKVQDPVEVGD
jgi:drug/metabolite transporter (DMT)-like permease